MKTSLLHRCTSCGRGTDRAGHLCEQIVKQRSSRCCRCNAVLGNFRHACHPNHRPILYVCGQCGRAAERAEDVCEPIEF